MLILKEFFEELHQINATENQNWKMYSKTNKSRHYDPEELIESRIDFNTKYKRIIRGLDLLSDKELIFLNEYYTGRYIIGIDDVQDKVLFDLIYSVENAA